MVVGRLLVIIHEVDMLLRHRMISLWTFILAHIMLTWRDEFIYMIRSAVFYLILCVVIDPGVVRYQIKTLLVDQSMLLSVSQMLCAV